MGREAREPTARERDGAAERREPDEIPFWEWAVAALGLLLVVATLAFLLREAVRADTPPDVRVTVERVERVGAGYLVQFRARNDGTTPAAGVRIVGTLALPDGETEESEATLDYASPRSEHGGGLYFARDPRAGRLSLRVSGFTNP